MTWPRLSSPPPSTQPGRVLIRPDRAAHTTASASRTARWAALTTPVAISNRRWACACSSATRGGGPSPYQHRLYPRQAGSSRGRAPPRQPGVRAQPGRNAPGRVSRCVGGRDRDHACCAFAKRNPRRPACYSTWLAGLMRPAPDRLARRSDLLRSLYRQDRTIQSRWRGSPTVLPRFWAKGVPWILIGGRPLAWVSG